MPPHPFRTLARGSTIVAALALVAVVAGWLLPASGLLSREGGQLLSALAAIPLIVAALMAGIAALFAGRAERDLAAMDAGEAVARWTVPADDWNRWVRARGEAAGRSRIFLPLLAFCGALVTLAFVEAAGYAVLLVGIALGAAAGFAVDRARPGAIRRALGTARADVDVRVGRDGVLMNGRYTSWTAQRLDPASVTVVPGDPAVLHLTAHALADDSRVPVAYQLPVPAAEADRAAAALRALAGRR